MRQKIKRSGILFRLRLKKLWLGFSSTPVARKAKKQWHHAPLWGKGTFVGVLAIAVIGAGVFFVAPSNAEQKSLSLGSADILSGTYNYGGIKLSADASSMQLQAGTAGSWDQASHNGQQVAPSMINAITRLVYGPNNMMYMLSSFNGICYLNRYDTEQQTWNRLSSPPIFCGAGTILTYDGVGSFYYAPGGPANSPSNRFFRYDIATNAWNELARFTSTIGDISDGEIVTQGNRKYVYIFRGQSSPSFWRYSITDNTWENLNAFPTTGTVSGGINIAWDGANTIYAMANNTGEFKSYNLTSGTWSSLVNQGSYGNIYQTMTYLNGTLYTVRLNYGSNIYSFRSYNPSTAIWTNLNAETSGGSEYDFPPPTTNDGSRYIYTLMGSEMRPQLQRYDTINSTWNSDTVLRGGSDSSEYHQIPAFDGNHTLHFVGGDGGSSSDRVYNYDINTNVTTRVGSQISTQSGGAGAYHNGSVYYLPINSTTTVFQRYDTASNAFVDLAAVPFTSGNGSSILNGGDGYLYATFGGRNNFYRYNISTNVWSALTSMPQTIGAGGNMTQIGRTIYVLIGSQSNFMVQYNMDTNVWSTVTNFPVGSVENGAFLTSDTTRYLYVGMSDRTQARGKMVLRYDTTNGSWVRIADLPYATYPYAYAFYSTAANKLYVVNGNLSGNVWNWSPGTANYTTKGTWYSKTYDLKQVATWTSLQSTITGSGTTVISTRTSPDGKIWNEWQPTSGQSIQSQVNRYIQVKVTLSGNGTATPTVSGLRINYDQETSAPSLPSQFSAFDKKDGTQLSSGATGQHQHPYLTWSGANDGVNGSGVAGYYVYFGTSSSADPVLAGSYQTESDYIVTTPMTAGEVYYVRIKAVDALGNVSSAATFFSYRYFYISPPGSQIRTSDNDFSQGINTGVNVNNGSMSLQSISTGAWGTGPMTMPPEDTRGGTMTVVGDYLYTARGSTTNTFWRYNTVTMNWSTLASVPTTVANGSSMTYDGNDTIYLAAGNSTTSFFKYSITNDIWTALPALPSNAQLGMDIKYLGNDRIAIFMTGVREFYTYTISTGSFTPLTSYPTSISTGGSGIWFDGNDTIYAYLGAWAWNSTGRSRPTMTAYSISTDTWKVLATAPISAAFTQNNLLSDGQGGLLIFTSNLVDGLTADQRSYRYDIANDRWSEVLGVPVQSYNGSATSDGKRFIYILPGGNGTNSRKIVRYDTWTKTFTPSMPAIDSLDRLPWDTPVNAYQWIGGNATSAVYDGSKYIYALMGNEANNSTSRFVKFDYKTAETQYLTSPPVIGVSGAMGYVNGELYYLPSKGTRTFYKYDFSTDIWNFMTDLPAVSYRPGASGIVTVGSTMYVAAGNGRNFYQYTPNGSGGTWTTLTQSPGNILNGSLYYDNQANAIYVIAGNGNAFYRFNVASNTWTTLATLPASSTYGSALIVKNGKAYATLGNLGKLSYVYDISSNTWSTGTSSPEQFNYGSKFLDVSDTYALAFAGGSSPDVWQFTYPSATTAFNGQATHLSTTFTTSGLFDYANVTAQVTIPTNTAVELWTRSSADDTNWEDWKLVSNVKKYSGSVSGSVNSTPQRYTQIKTVLISYDNVSTPTVNDYSLNYYYDVDPPTNPTTFDAYSNSSKTTHLLNNTWYNNARPYLDWPDPGEAGGATDGPLGSNVAGYWVYVGTDSTATPRTAGQFVTGTDFTPNLTLAGTYYVRIQAQDTTGNVDSEIFSPFIYKFDNQPPTNPSLITVTPSGFTTRNNYTFVWPNAYDANSGVAGYCYYTGAPDGPFAVEICQDGTSLENVSAAYQSGTNVFYVRAYDTAGNYAPSYTTASYYYTTDPPGPVTNLRAVPPTSTSNLFAFTWDLPIVYSGDPDQMTYCYSINILPSPENVTCTGDRFLSAFKAATQRGTNIIYMVAKDEAGNVNWSSFASANFIANTVSPGIPLNVSATDTSDRTTSRWTITTTWDAPTFAGNGIKDYVVQRSTDGRVFTTIGNTSTRAFVDLDVQLDQQYYYRVAAQDSVENMSGFSGIVIQSAKGTFNSPPEIVVQPTVSVGFDQARINWATNRASTSFVYYGTSPSDLSQSKGALDLMTDHSQTITGLLPARTYYYRVQSFDNDRNYNLSDAYSDIGTFRTTAAAQIGEVRVSDITADSAVLTWTTTVPTNARIQYGDNRGYGLSLDDEAGSFMTTHTSRLTGLSAGTNYHFKINSTTTFGSTLASDDYTFTTIARPIVSNIKFQPIENEPSAGVVVSWTTNVPTSSTVHYQALGTRLESSRGELTTDHSIDLHNLASNTDYQFTIEGRDQYGNLTTSSVQNWTSQVDTRPPELSEISYNVTTSESSKGKQAQLIVTWKTDEPSTSQIAYGGMNDKTLTKKTPLDTEPTSSHVVVISGLNLADIYKIQVLSRDLDGNTAKGSATTVVTPDKQLNAFDTILDLMLRLFRF